MSVAVVEQRAKECIKYFRERPVFAKIFKGFRKKYTSYGIFAGIVILKNLTVEEMEDLEGFFQKSFHGQVSVSISADRFAKALEKSRFAGISPKTLLELYFGEEMAGKRELKQRVQQEREKEIADIREIYRGTPAEKWLEEFGNSNSSIGDLEQMHRFLDLGARIINNLPFREHRTEYLAVFAARLTGNPHAFDVGARDGAFLYQLVQWVLGQKGELEEKSELFPALQKKREYLLVGILLDDISNFVMISGVRAKKSNGQPHTGMEGFFAEGDMLHIPLSVLVNWESANCPDNEIYIMENPSVYALFVGKWRGSRAAMCMNGQPRLSSIIMLDLLAKTKTKIYYAGDFDPEGILIAQKLKQYYPGEFSFWHMSTEDYAQSISEEAIGEKRLKILDKITDEELRVLAEEIGKRKFAGYQENIWKKFT